MKRYLIVTADDFGFSKERNQGVKEAFENFGVKNASLLLNCTGTDDAIHIFKSHNMCSGLHLNLTEGQALSETKYSTLTDSSGNLFGKDGLRELLNDGKIDPLEIKHEIECQIQQFKTLIGKTPAYVDGHQHIHVHPAVAEIFASALHSHGIQVTRFPVEVSMEVKTWVKPNLMPFFFQMIKDSENCKSIFDSYGIRYSDTFTGLSTMGSDMTLTRLQSNILEAFQHAEKHCDKSKSYVTCELMTHPGYATGKHDGGFNGHSDEFGCSKDRELEISILTSKEMFEFYKENNVQLVSQEILSEVSLDS